MELRPQRRAPRPRRRPPHSTAWRCLAGCAAVLAATATTAAASWPRLTLTGALDGIGGGRSRVVGGDSGAGGVAHVERAIWDEASATRADGTLDPDLAAYRDAYRAAAAATAAVEAAAAADAAHPWRAAVARAAVAAGVAPRPPPAAPCFAADEAAGAAGRLDWADHQAASTRRLQVAGTASTFDLLLDATVPAAETDAIVAAARLWAAVWPSSVPVRTRVQWATDLSSDSLGATNIPAFVEGGQGITRDDAQYGAPLFLSLTGTDVLPASRPHVQMKLNRGVPWHAGTGPAPRGRFDLTTVAAHELGHGLFFTGRIGYDQSGSRVGLFGGRGGGDPARFDTFIADMEGNGVVASCAAGRSVDSQGLLNAVTARGLSFVVNGSADSAAGRPRTALPLYAPASFKPGSSIYHFDGGGDQLRRGCTASGIPAAACSDLMVAQLPAGKTARALGDNTLRVMEAMRDQARTGVPGGTCSVSPNAPGSEGEGGIDGFPGGGGGGGLRFSIPPWAVITLGVAAALSVLLFVAALLTNVVFPAIRRRPPPPRSGGRAPAAAAAAAHADPAVAPPMAPPPVATGTEGAWPPPVVPAAEGAPWPPGSAPPRAGAWPPPPPPGGWPPATPPPPRPPAGPDAV